MNLVDEEDVARREIRERAHEIAGFSSAGRTSCEC
jgi:hypothetical protein